jgi:hypothetical protein
VVGDREGGLHVGRARQPVVGAVAGAGALTDAADVIDIVAFDASDRMIRGSIELTGSRLTDTLAAGGVIVAHAVLIRDLARGRVERHERVLLDTRRLRIALATGPRGSLLQRVAVLALPATVHVDGYVVHGLLHAPTPRDPVREAAHRSWLPLTDCVLEHRPGGVLLRERYDGLLVNRAHAHAIVATDARAHEARWVAASDPASLLDPARFGHRR